MNDSQRSYLLATFQHVDQLLGEARRVLAAGASSSVFAPYQPDASPVQRSVAEASIDEIARLTLRSLDELGLPRPRATTGVLWAARTRLAFAQVDFDGMTPARLASYGPLPAAEAETVERVAAELKSALGRLSAYLAQGADADLPARLKALEQTRDEVPLLRELERVIRTHGLVALRGTLEMLLERLENGRFEVGVFGRVSSGKSSLLNRLIGTAVLPVGVTPVTAVPTRVQFGDAARARVEFAQAPPQTIALARLPEFATEQGNPDNRRQVTRIVVEVDAPRLREGVTWVDTPGLGSLSSHGAAETTAYVPRCDLGLVLIDAGATLTQDDQLLVQALLRAGADAMVLVSKADLLGPAQRAQFVAYVQAHLAAQFGAAPPVHLVSVVGTDAALCDAWFEQVLQPRLAAHREQAAAALKRKVGLLRDVVIRTLEARSETGAGEAPTAAPDAAIRAALGALHAGAGWIAATRREVDARLDRWPAQAEALLAASAASLAEAWHTMPAVDAAVATQVCGAVLRQDLDRLSAELRAALLALGARLDDALHLGQCALGTAAEAADAVEALPRLAGEPLLDVDSAVRTLDLKPPALRALLPRAWTAASVQRRLRAQWGARLAAFLEQGAQRLRAWAQAALDDWERSFGAGSASLGLQIEERTRPAPPADRDAVAADLRRLREFDGEPR